LNALRSTGMSLEQAAFQINRMMDQQAFTRAADDIFLGSALLFLALIPVVWLSRPVANPAGAPVDAGGAH
jgi:DHA2 family multidrug resistance protein